jgi:hypothetical protein
MSRQWKTVFFTPDPFRNANPYLAFLIWWRQCSMFCISGELKNYQGIKVEWIGSSAQPDIGNLPPGPYRFTTQALYQ